MYSKAEFFKRVETLNRYMLLSRMQSDCEYYLSYGNKQQKYLWAGNPSEQITYMVYLFESFQDTEKPEWISLQDIEEYKSKMIQ